MHLDQYDILAFVLGIFLMIRRLDARAREPSQHPSVQPEAFARWRALAVRAYTIGSLACLLRLVFHFGFARYASHTGLEPKLFMRTALLADVAWWVALVVCFVQARSAAKLRRELGILLDAPSSAS